MSLAPSSSRPDHEPRSRLSSWFGALALCGALALGALTGCAPSVSVRYAEVRGASAEGVSMVMHLVIDNDNAFDVQLRHVRANVTMAGRYRLSPIHTSPNKWLPAGKKTRVSVPVTVPWGTVPGLLAASAGSSEIEYRIVGAADVTAGRSARIRANAWPIDDSGTVPRSRFTKGSLPGGLGLPF